VEKMLPIRYGMLLKIYLAVDFMNNSDIYDKAGNVI
jgi:hypothetical protein